LNYLDIILNSFRASDLQYEDEYKREEEDMGEKQITVWK